MCTYDLYFATCSFFNSNNVLAYLMVIIITKIKYFINKNCTSLLSISKVKKKDVGVNFSPDLTFDLHISTITKNVSNDTGIISKQICHIQENS